VVIPVGFVDTEPVVEQWLRDHPAPTRQPDRSKHDDRPVRRRKSVWQRLFS
jgi:hypothetical protein